MTEQPLDAILNGEQLHLAIKSVVEEHPLEFDFLSVSWFESSIDFSFDSSFVLSFEPFFLSLENCDSPMTFLVCLRSCQTDVKMIHTKVV